MLSGQHGNNTKGLITNLFWFLIVRVGERVPLKIPFVETPVGTEVAGEGLLVGVGLDVTFEVTEGRCSVRAIGAAQ